MKFVKSTLGKIALEIKTGKTPPTSNQEYFGDELNWYTPTDLDREKILGKSKRRITQKAFNDKKVVVLKPNTVLLGCIGDIGKIGLIREPATSNQQITGILPKEEVLNSEFLYYWLKHNRKKLKDASTSAIVSILNNKQLSAVKIQFPENLKDQIRIAEILTKAETLITQRKESILMLDELLKSSFLEMFGDPVTNEKEWVVTKLKDVCTKITDGTHFSPPIVDVGIPYITAKHVRENKIDFWAKPWFISEEDHKEIYKRCTPKKGDILYIKDGATTGYSAINRYDFEFSMLSSLALLKVNYKILNAEYLNSWLNNDIVKTRILKGMAGGAIKRLTLTKINQLPINVPPIELQNQYATIVKKVEILKTEYKYSLVELENMYGVLSQKAFKGELQIKQ